MELCAGRWQVVAFIDSARLTVNKILGRPQGVHHRERTGAGLNWSGRSVERQKLPRGASRPQHPRWSQLVPPVRAWVELGKVF